MDLKERITAWVDAHQAEYFDDLSKLIAVDSAKGEALEGKPFRAAPTCWHWGRTF